MKLKKNYYENAERKRLSQYYTTSSLGNYLISLLPRDKIFENALDLSAGEGALLKAISEHSRDVQCVGVDIDPKNVIKLAMLKNCIAFHADSTLKTLLEINEISERKYSLILGNPPFQLIDSSEYIREIFKKFNITYSKKKVRSEVFFLFLSLALLQKDGFLAFILPDGYLTNNSHAEFRKKLSEQFRIFKVVEVPPGSFEGTEAKTHMIIVQNSEPHSHIRLAKSDDLLKEIEITNEDFVCRSDFSFYEAPKSLHTTQLGNLDIEMLRGSMKVHEEFKSLNLIHTSSLSFEGTELISSDDYIPPERGHNRLAVQGDIILARVGTRVIGKFGVVSKGVFRVSDCVIIIRCDNKKMRDSIINTLKSSFGKEWIKLKSKGVGARHIPMNELVKLPVFY